MRPEIQTSSPGCLLRRSATADVRKCRVLTLRLRYLRTPAGTPPLPPPSLLHAAVQHRRQRVLAGSICRAGHAHGGYHRGVGTLYSPDLGVFLQAHEYASAPIMKCFRFAHDWGEHAGHILQPTQMPPQRGIKMARSSP